MGRQRRAPRWGALGVASALLLFACNPDNQHSLGSHREALPGSDQEPRAEGGAGGAPTGQQIPDCVVMTPPSELALDARFERFASAGGLAIVALDDVDDDALQVACERTLTLLSARPDVHETMVEEGATVVVVDQEASLADVPELSSVEDPELSTYRSYGAERDRPVMVIGEENLLCLPDNPYAGESLFVHAFAHTVLSLGIEPLEPDFTARLQTTYESAVNEGRWQDTFAITTPRQYFAEGVQSYFSVNDEASPANGVHNDVNTGPELEAYDPQLYALIGEYFGPSVTIPLCPEAP